MSTKHRNLFDAIASFPALLRACMGWTLLMYVVEQGYVLLFELLAAKADSNVTAGTIANAFELATGEISTRLTYRRNST